MARIQAAHKGQYKRFLVLFEPLDPKDEPVVIMVKDAESAEDAERYAKHRLTIESGRCRSEFKAPKARRLPRQ